jgi:glutathione S-transferase
MQGQANHFNRYAPVKIQYGIDRYINETRRLYSVLERQLSKPNHPYLVGEKLTIADIANWTWVYSAAWAGVDITEFPKLQEWEQRVLERPAVEKGRHVPDRHRIKEILADKEKMKEYEAKSSQWVMESMKDAAK